MLTVCRLFSSDLKDIHNSIMVEWCMAKSRKYLECEDYKKSSYWSKMTGKYLLKRIDYLRHKGLL